MSLYRIDGTGLKIAKILSAHGRKSFLYWKYPYVIDLVYSKRWTEQTFIYVGKGLVVPMSIQRETWDYKFKYMYRHDVFRELKNLKDLKVPNITYDLPDDSGVFKL